MTKKLEKAKAETIQKFNGVLEAVRVAKHKDSGRCGFCFAYGWPVGSCKDCPIDKLCGGKLDREIRDMLFELEEKIIKGISLLEDVKEKK